MVELWILQYQVRAGFERDPLLRRAWGDLPVSFCQDQEDLNACAYLDVKVNKWEIDKRWSAIQPREPWIRLEFFRGDSLRVFLAECGVSLVIWGAPECLVVLRIDEGGWEIDRRLAMTLASVIADGGAIFAREGRDLFPIANVQMETFTSAELKDMLSRASLNETPEN